MYFQSYRIGFKAKVYLKGWYKDLDVSRETLVAICHSLRIEFDLQSGSETGIEQVGVSDYGLDKTTIVYSVTCIREVFLHELLHKCSCQSLE